MKSQILTATHKYASGCNEGLALRNFLRSPARGPDAVRRQYVEFRETAFPARLSYSPYMVYAKPEVSLRQIRITSMSALI